MTFILFVIYLIIRLTNQYLGFLNRVQGWGKINENVIAKGEYTNGENPRGYTLVEISNRRVD